MQDIWNYENVYDICATFSRINELKQIIKAGEEAKEEYANVVNELLEVALDDSQKGEEIAQKALKLASMVQRAEKAKESLIGYEQELCEKYGFRRHREIKEAV